MMMEDFPRGTGKTWLSEADTSVCQKSESLYTVTIDSIEHRRGPDISCGETDAVRSPMSRGFQSRAKCVARDVDKKVCDT